MDKGGREGAREGGRTEEGMEGRRREGRRRKEIKTRYEIVLKMVTISSPVLLSIYCVESFHIRAMFLLGIVSENMFLESPSHRERPQRGKGSSLVRSLR